MGDESKGQRGSTVFPVWYVRVAYTAELHAEHLFCLHRSAVLYWGICTKCTQNVGMSDLGILLCVCVSGFKRVCHMFVPIFDISSLVLACFAQTMQQFIFEMAVLKTGCTLRKRVKCLRGCIAKSAQQSGLHQGKAFSKFGCSVPLSPESQLLHTCCVQMGCMNLDDV
jgi:hypothetical protein